MYSSSSHLEVMCNLNVFSTYTYVCVCLYIHIHIWHTHIYYNRLFCVVSQFPAEFFASYYIKYPEWEFRLQGISVHISVLKVRQVPYSYLTLESSESNLFCYCCLGRNNIYSYVTTKINLSYSNTTPKISCLHHENSGSKHQATRWGS